MSIFKSLSVPIVTLTFACAVHAQTPLVERIRGDIVSLRGDVLTVQRRGGDTASIELKPDATLSALKPIKLSDVKVGTYVGLPATSRADGKLTASAVLVFPESARGTKEGHFPYDFGPTSTMTNANVEAIVTGNNGRDIKVSYKGGSNTITVPKTVPVVTFSPATRADLSAGKKVVMVVRPLKQGAFEAQVVFVEKDGVVPPL